MHDHDMRKSQYDGGQRGTAPGQRAAYAEYEIDFRAHHAAHAAERRGSYVSYRLVYHYGYDLATDPRYRTAEWAKVVLAARPRWEERNPGTWDEFQETIRYAWDRAQRQP